MLKLSGWETDFSGGKMDVYPKNEMSLNWFKLADTSSEASESIRHLIARQTNGLLTFEFRFKLPKITDDISWGLLGLDGNGIVIKTDKSNLCFETSNKKLQVIQTYEPGTEYGVKVVADLSLNLKKKYEKKWAYCSSK